MMKPKPDRCIDPVIKFCQECEWGWVEYPAWVETAEDLAGCTFKYGCKLGYDRGRPEDEPTKEELKELEVWLATKTKEFGKKLIETYCNTE